MLFRGANKFIFGIGLIALAIVVSLWFLFPYAATPEPSPKTHPLLPRSMPPAPKTPSRAVAPNRMHNVLRLAKFDCQRKAELIADRGGQAVVVEVGAFDGAETRLFAEKSRRVYSFEATPSKEETILRNIGDYGDRVSLHMVGVSDRPGTLKLHIPDGPGGAQQDAFGDQRFFMGNDVRTIDVPVTTIDAVVREHVDLLTTDTQGHECHVIRGAENLIRTHGVDILHIEFSPKLLRSSQCDPEQFLRDLHDLGYVCFDCDGFSPPPADKFRSFAEFSNNFGPFHFMKGDHGRWTDILCFS
jgi:FkbM family methyltransferase